MRMNIRSKPLARLSAVLLTTLLGAAFLSAPANADPGSPAPQAAAQSKRLQRGMNVVGFDEKVAAAHGYKIVTYADGSRQSVPIDKNDKTKQPGVRLAAGFVAPAVVQDTVYGNCGYSYIEAEQNSAHNIWLNTGFGVKSAAISRTWTVELQDQNGFSYQSSNGAVALSRTWSKAWNGLNQYGWSSQDVLPSSSALLATGEICTSGGPGIYWYVSY